MAGRRNHQGKKRKVADEEEWCPSASSVQKRKSRGQRRIAYAELSDSDSDCMIDEERSTFRTAKVVPAASLLVSMNGGILPGTTINNDSSLSNASKVFKSFPVELHQLIAGYLPEDTDIRAYRLICRETVNAIDNSVWRARFAVTFDRIDSIKGQTPTSAHMAKIYKTRKALRKETILFIPEYDSTPEELTWKIKHQALVARVLRDMILESNAYIGRDENGDNVVIGYNHDYIRDWLSREDTKDPKPFTDVAGAILRTNHDWDLESHVGSNTDGALILVVQLALGSLLLDYSILGIESAVPSAQSQAYVDRRTQPAFFGKHKTEINVKWILNVIGYMAFHLKTEHEGVLNCAYFEFSPDELAQPWTGKLQDATQPFGSKWKCAYTYLQAADLLELREIAGDDEEREKRVFQEEYEPLQDVVFCFDEESFPSTNWPKSWDALIDTNPYLDHNNTPPAEFSGRMKRTRSSRSPKPELPARVYDIKSFYGSTIDAEGGNMHFFGRLHGLPPQQGIPGFQRVSFLRFQESKSSVYEETQIWGYEGCVLPGGNIITGRWWHILPGATLDPVYEYAGPFVFWNVDLSEPTLPIIKDAYAPTPRAVNFLNRLRDTGVVY